MFDINIPIIGALHTYIVFFGIRIGIIGYYFLSELDSFICFLNLPSFVVSVAQTDRTPGLKMGVPLFLIEQVKTR